MVLMKGLGVQMGQSGGCMPLFCIIEIGLQGNVIP